jgi:hypothetical protein
MHGSPSKPKRPLRGETGKRRVLFPQLQNIFSSREANHSMLFPPSATVSRRRARASRDITVLIGASVV